MEPRRIYDYRSPHCQPHCTAASDPGYRSLRAFLLVKRQGAMDHLRKPWPHETHARERSRNRRERSDVPHSARPMSLFGIGQSQAKSAYLSQLSRSVRKAFCLSTGEAEGLALSQVKAVNCHSRYEIASSRRAQEQIM